MTQVAVLSYHKIGEPPADGWDSWYYVPAHTLEAQLGFLLEGGWQPIDHNSLLVGLDHPECLPERSVLVTFDDAYHSLAEYAWPVLARTGFPCVVFVPTAFIGRTNLFDDGEEPTESISTWSDLREWASDGVSIQSHGVRHRPMSEIPRNEQRFELLQSRSQLQEGLGLDVELFAFPYGDDGDQPSVMTTLVKDIGYRAAFLYGGGAFDPAHTDRYRLPRLAMGPDTELEAVLRSAGDRTSNDGCPQGKLK